jgi:hypothetical protein
MKRVGVSLLWLWDFVVGEDWRTALGVAVALGAVAALAAMGIAAWWPMPPAVLLLLALSLRRATASS